MTVVIVEDWDRPTPMPSGLVLDTAFAEWARGAVASASAGCL